MGKPAAKGAAYRALVSSALRSDGVAIEDAAVFLLLASFGDPDGANCYPSKARLAAMSGHSDKWVGRALIRLKRAGWISWRHKPVAKGVVNVYTLHWGQIGPDRVFKETEEERTLGRGQNGRGGRVQNGVCTLLHIPDEARHEEADAAAASQRNGSHPSDDA